MPKHIFTIVIDAPDAKTAAMKLQEKMSGRIQFDFQVWPDLPEAPEEHPYAWAEEAADIIDANIFSGDAGYFEGIAYYKAKCERWLKELERVAESFAEAEAEAKAEATEANHE